MIPPAFLEQWNHYNPTHIIRELASDSELQTSRCLHRTLGAREDQDGTHLLLMQVIKGIIRLGGVGCHRAHCSMTVLTGYFISSPSGLFIFLPAVHTNSGDNMKKLGAAIGFAVGVINTLLGAGGGMLVVPTLKAQGLEQKQAQATAIAVILPLTIVSAVIYLLKNNVSVKGALFYIPFGLIGSVLGSMLLPKLSGKTLNIMFGVFLIYSAVRMFLK